MLFNPFEPQTPRFNGLTRLSLAIGTIFGSASLIAGGAQAAGNSASCSFNGGLGFPACSTNTPLQFQGDDKIFTILNIDTIGLPGHLDYTWFTPSADANYSDDSWSMLITFDSPNQTASTTGYWDYTFTVAPIAGAGWNFKSVELDSTHAGNGVNVDKFINDPTFTTPYLTSTDGNPDGPKALSGKAITVRDKFTVGATGTLSTFNNVYTQSRDSVPGPLPLLGAGAAFGFSRQLRKRIRKYTLA